MARGLRKSWKQPVFYNFDSQMAKQILYEIIRQLYEIGFPVVATVCDMGPTNRKLWKELDVTSDKPWFPNPANQEEKVFTFADAPHLLKLIRNHFLDTGFLVNNQMLTSRTIVDFLKHTSSSDATITFKLTDEHLLVKGVGRQKVKLATQLFSNCTANAIRRCFSVGLDIYMPTETSDLIQLVNDWFDVLNSTANDFGLPGKEPFGILLESQQLTLRRMNEMMSAPIIPNKRSLEWFQKGILLTNNALQMLHDYVKQKFNMAYILTYRLNQDVIEHFFGALRSKGGLYDHPSPKEFVYRLRKYILVRNTELLKGTGNCKIDSTQWLGSCNTLEIPGSSDCNHEVNTTERVFEDEELENMPTDSEKGLFDDLNTAQIDDIGILQEDALEYISGFIIRKRNLEQYLCHESSFTWVDQVSKGSLKKPSSEFVNLIKKLEWVFNDANKKEISIRKNIKQYLIERSSGVDLPEDVKSFFFKCRIHFRLRHSNKRLKVQKAKQRIMGYKKLIKIKL